MAIKSRTRKSDVKVKKTRKGTEISCPFCDPTHPIGLAPSHCGTKLEIKAVQEIYTGATCAFCGKQNGNMIKVGNVFVHSPNCSPNMRLFNAKQKTSLSAKVIHNMPNIVDLLIYRLTGNRTAVMRKGDEVVGYTWTK